MKTLKSLWIALSLLALVSCGGGGGNSGTSPFVPSPDSVAADLIVQSSTSQVQSSSAATATITVTAIDASRNALSNIPVTVSADGGAIINASTTTTDSTGKVVATLTLGADRSNRVITVTAISGTISKSTLISVAGSKITSTLDPAVVPPSSAGDVLYRLIDAAGSPIADADVTITAAGLTPSTTTTKTGANGDFRFDYTSPATTGTYPITAQAGGVSDLQQLQVQPTNTLPSVTVPITSASVSANPSVVAVNLPDSGSNRSEIRALFLGTSNQPVANVRVRFDLENDVNSVGGTFTTGTKTLYSDANGIVTTAYVPGTRSSPTNGVTVRACYGVSDTDPNLLNCTTSTKVTLTVTSEPLGVSIGTNETIIVNDLTYAKKFLVSVADSAGVAKAGVDLVVSLDLVNFRKGRYAVTATGWAKIGPLASGDAAICSNEDVNRNGVLEATEDTNHSGRLEPGKSDVIVSLLQSKTQADGTAVLQIQYAKSFGSWVDALITVAASGVAGTEGRATYLLAPVPVDSSSIKASDVQPAYMISPYGLVADCTDKN